VRNGIRSNRGRAAALRAVWTWPLQTKTRAWVCLGALVLVVVVAGRISIAAGGTDATPATTTAPPSSTSAAGAVPYPVATTSAGGSPNTSSPNTPSSSSATSTTPTVAALGPAAPQPALLAAQQFMTAWVNTKAADWVQGLSPYATPELTARLRTVDARRLTSTRLLGEPTVASVDNGSVDLNWPTNTDAVHLTVIDTGGPWKVSAVTKAA
jgi:hypothetical protein